MGEGPEDGLLGEPTWGEGVNRDSGNRQRSKADAARLPALTIPESKAGQAR